MLHCHRCESELPEGAKFCNNCGLNQTNPILVAIPRIQKDIQTGNLDEKQIPVTPHIALDNDVLPTAKIEAVRLPKANKSIKNDNDNENGVVSHVQTPSLKVRLTQHTGPIYIGRVVSVGRKPFRRNLLLTRVGLYITLAILTCLIIGIGFTLVYIIFHQTH
jgi:hypothetical protein